MRGRRPVAQIVSSSAHGAAHASGWPAAGRRSWSGTRRQARSRVLQVAEAVGVGEQEVRTESFCKHRSQFRRRSRRRQRCKRRIGWRAVEEARFGIFPCDCRSLSGVVLGRSVLMPVAYFASNTSVVLVKSVRVRRCRRRRSASSDSRASCCSPGPGRSDPQTQESAYGPDIGAAAVTVIPAVCIAW